MISKVNENLIPSQTMPNHPLRGSLARLWHLRCVGLDIRGGGDAFFPETIWLSLTMATLSGTVECDPKVHMHGRTSRSFAHIGVPNRSCMSESWSKRIACTR